MQLRLFLVLGLLYGSGQCRVKRSDDANPLQAIVDRLVQDVTTLQAEVQTLKSAQAKKVAFRAVLTSETIPTNAPIHFNLESMVGGGYDQRTGVFTAPFSGWYTFDMRLYSHGPAYYHMDLYVDNGLKNRARCDDPDHPFACSSGTSLHLNAGNKVWLQSDRAGPFYHIPADNAFSGALLFADD